MNYLKKYIFPFAACFFVVWVALAFIKMEANVFDWDELTRFALVLLGFVSSVVYAAVFGFERTKND